MPVSIVEEKTNKSKPDAKRLLLVIALIIGVPLIVYYLGWIISHLSLGLSIYPINILTTSIIGILAIVILLAITLLLFVTTLFIYEAYLWIYHKDKKA